MSEAGPGIDVLDKRVNNPEVYTFKTKSGKAVNAVFYSAQEIPSASDFMRDRKVFVYGGKPKDIPDQEWFGAQENIRQSSLNKNLKTKGTYWWDISEAINQENALFMVEATPINVLDLAFTMGVDSPSLRNLRLAFFRGQVTDATLDFTDAIIAGKIVDAQGDIRTDKNFEGEVLIIRALSGDQEAELELKKRQQTLLKLDSQQYEEEVQRLKAEIPELERQLPQGEKRMEPQDLALIRVVPEEPTRQDGRLVIQTVFDRSGFIPRPTLHFTLNHVVGAHSGGDWTGTQVAIISPYDKAVELNGNPISLNTSDTFFALTPGKAFVLPDESTVIKPGKTESGELFEKAGKNEIVYKTKDFTPEDIQKIEFELDRENPQLFEADGSHLGNTIGYSLEHKIYDYWKQKTGIGNPPDYESPEFKEFFAQSKKDIKIMTEVLTQINEPGNLFEILKTRPLADLLTDLRTHLSGKIDESLSAELELMVKNAIEVQLGNEIQTLVLQDTLQSKGYKWMTSSSWGGFHIPSDRLKFDLLAFELGIPQRPHDADPNLKLQGFLAKSLANGELSINKNKRSEILTVDTLVQIDPASRRMLYQMGLL